MVAPRAPVQDKLHPFVSSLESYMELSVAGRPLHDKMLTASTHSKGGSVSVRRLHLRYALLSSSAFFETLILL